MILAGGVAVPVVVITPVVVVGDAIGIGTVVGIVVIGDAVGVGAVVRVVVVGDSVRVGAVVRVVVVGDPIRVGAVVGVVVIGDAVRVGAVVGIVVIGNAIIVGAVVRVIVVGDTVIGDPVVARAIVGVVIVLELRVHLSDLAGVGVHLVLVLHAVQDELHLVLPVVQVVLLLHELQVVPAQLGGEDALGGGGVDVPLVAVGIVVVVLVQGHGLRADLVGLHHQPDRLGQFIEELVAGIGGAPLQLQDDVLLVAAHGGVEVAQGIDLVHQLSHHLGTGPALVAGVGGQQGLGLLVAAGEGHHVASVVIVHLDLRVHTEQDSAHGAAALFQKGGAGAGGLGEGRRAGAVPAGGQSGQGQGGGQGQGKQFGVDVLFHVFHLLEHGVWFCVLILDYGAAAEKPGSGKNFFHLLRLTQGGYGGRPSKPGPRRKFFCVNRRHPALRHRRHHHRHRRPSRRHRRPGHRRHPGPHSRCHRPHKGRRREVHSR